MIHAPFLDWIFAHLGFDGQHDAGRSGITEHRQAVYLADALALSGEDLVFLLLRYV